ncbi:MAG: ribonuclease Z [Lachnospiraceae bacterium]|nr:ribonuclease Z [Lachnospiraceae bacterium]MBR6475624.1 ribonuclease Z [Lachnospiraceae bacterium]
MLDLCLLGTGGMMPLPYRRLTSLMTRFNGSSLLIDCGEGTQVAIRERGWSFHDIDVICITHFHGDHISGLPGLLLSMGNAERTEPVTIIGPKGLEKTVNALRIIAPELPFDIKFIELADPVSEFNLFGYRLTAFKVNHRITCYGYSINIDRAGKFDPEKAEKNNVPMKAWSRLQKGRVVEIDGVTYTQDMILGPERKGIKVTYCTDTRPVKIISEMAAGSDIFICEGMYGVDDKDNKAVEHKHMTFNEAARLAAAADPAPKEMWLTHYSPSMVNPAEYIGNLKKIFPNSIAAKDLRTVTLNFIEEAE